MPRARRQAPSNLTVQTSPAPLPGYLEVEIGSYCNRRCAWCPNGWHTRGQQREHMAQPLWGALLDDLAKHNYSGIFCFHNYNEPLADPGLCAKIAQARLQIPRARLAIYSNGNLLTPVRLARLERAGVRELRVTRYPGKRHMLAEPDPQTLLDYLHRLGIDSARVEQRPRRVVCHARHGHMRILVGAPRISSYTSRGNSVGLPELQTTTLRDWPCYYPLDSAAIDYHGNFKLCCHIYDTTRPHNAPYIVGNVGETPFSALWSSPRLQQLREQLGTADFTGLPLCLSCGHRMVPRMERHIRSRSSRQRPQSGRH